jgi:hypothetical protein
MTETPVARKAFILGGGGGVFLVKFHSKVTKIIVNDEI